MRPTEKKIAVELSEVQLMALLEIIRFAGVSARTVLEVHKDEMSVSSREKLELIMGGAQTLSIQLQTTVDTMEAPDRELWN